MRRKPFVVVFLALACVVAGLVVIPHLLTAQPGQSEPGLKSGPGSSVTQPATLKSKPEKLPISKVILYTSGVGYFQREGQVEGNAHIDLSFPAGDLNDLLKSLVLRDLNGGKISTVSYDSHDPIDKTLKSFAVNLSGNPSFADILNQIRGEKITVLWQPPQGQQTPVAGTNLGVEKKKQPVNKEVAADVEYVNVWSDKGMRSIKLTEVIQVHFQNPALTSEVNRALQVVAQSHDTQKKIASLFFSGKGKRTVQVGYVMGHPIWRTSYRLVLSKEIKPFLQGWAMVENPSNEDWNGVNLSLVSGKPVSFRVNLYQPLYVDRPLIQLQLFQNLKPTTYEGDMDSMKGRPFAEGKTDVNRLRAAAVLFRQYCIVCHGPNGTGVPAMRPTLPMLPDFTNPTWQEQHSDPQLLISVLNGKGTFMPAHRGRVNEVQGRDLVAFIRNFAPMGATTKHTPTMEFQRQFEQLQRHALLPGAAEFAGGIQQTTPTMAQGLKLGDQFQYVINQPINVARQKSALVPIVNASVEGTKVSIYNEKNLAKFPMLGLKFKNTTPLHLMQGPITVFAEDSYAGDALISDIQPGEERLLSFAIDLATEVKSEFKKEPEAVVKFAITKGIVHKTIILRDTKTYIAKNRSDQQKSVIFEHPIRAPEFALITPAKAPSQSQTYYRFEMNVPADATKTFPVVEERKVVEEIILTNANDQTLVFLQRNSSASPAMKEALQKAIDLKVKQAKTQADIAQLEGKIKVISQDQSRQRDNMKVIPQTDPVYKKYLDKFLKQEEQIDQLRAQIEQMQVTANQQRQTYENYVLNLTIKEQ
jgi:mono/diheme cytochrome c family protein